MDYGEILFSLNNGDFILIDEKFKNRNIKHIFKDKEVKLKTFIKFNNITYVGIINSLKIWTLVRNNI